MFVAQHLGCIQFAIMPRAFDELYHQDLKPLSHSARCRAQRGGGFALAGPGMDDNQTFSLVWQGKLLSGHRIIWTSGHRVISSSDHLDIEELNSGLSND